MLCNSNINFSPDSIEEEPEIWEHENHGHTKTRKKKAKKKSVVIPFDTILVASHLGDSEGLDLLSWAINVAARPGDSVILSHFNTKWDATSGGKLKSENIQGQEGLSAKLAALKDVCKIKQVKLDFKACHSCLDIIQQASSSNATMLVVRPSSRRELLRNIQKMGNSLARRIPASCSVAIVKDYKVLFYKEKASNSSCMVSEESPNLLHDWRTEGLKPASSLHNSSPCWGRQEEEVTCNLGSKLLANDAGGGSPRGVLDGFGVSSESDLSSPSSSHCSLSYSLSRKGLLSCVSLQDDKQAMCRGSPKRSMFMQRSLTFPSNKHQKKCPGPLDCKLMRSSFKSYINSLCSTESMSHDPLAPVPVVVDWRCFSYKELAIATDDFNSGNMVGKGGQAEVYKGMLDDGRLVAVKRLIQNSSEDVKEKEFLSELGIIGHVSHPNTVALVGFCVENGLYLIFEYSSYGSVSTLLHGGNDSVLEWSIRYKIAVGTARGVHYLHSGCQRRIIHRDIKASNILLGHEFEPQISDFGLAKWLPGDCTQLCVFPVEGTFGYLAPEYFMHGIVTEKTDVFAFGVFLLELITGRQPIDEHRHSLVMWARPLLESPVSLEDLADPRLEGAYDPRQMQSVVLAANLCVQSSASCRPNMSQVLELLTGGEVGSSHCIDTHLIQQSPYYHDACEEDEYSSSSYLNDLSRHRQLALQSEGPFHL